MRRRDTWARERSRRDACARDRSRRDTQARDRNMRDHWTLCVHDRARRMIGIPSIASMVGSVCTLDSM